jgi:peptide deformylase
MVTCNILKMGDLRLLRVAQPVTAFDTDALHLLISDMLDTMAAENGAGLAAPQIGVDLQVVIFGTGAPNPRYPDAPVVPRTVLVNPRITPLDAQGEPLLSTAYEQLNAAPLQMILSDVLSQQNTTLKIKALAANVNQSTSESALDKTFGNSLEEGWEGCLSVPGMRGVVQRFACIRYQGFDQYGDPIDRIAEGFHARVVQHECDHLLGVLYPMRVHDFSRFGFTQVLFPELADQLGDDD